ncbi:transposase [Paralcaligenes ureilyticus]|uniref:REP element-mobilizing transposase RayT n=1 Tax=Paralcaligenes ureilyticus TaxID=627131 RepID=A0A4V2UYY0_9BURK|nr:transposase [Paralcaligenes ureilyticus]TCT09108.1 REP element-mobilizing transposase RayT [Paralcaligenes ureilyticus]
MAQHTPTIKNETPLAPRAHSRHRPPRLPGYDYSQAGAYFITLCTHHRMLLFGQIENGQMRPNNAGLMVADVWETLPRLFPDLALDGFTIMPNHIHGILFISPPRHAFPFSQKGLALPVGDDPRSGHIRAKGPHTIGNIVGAFKSLSTLRYINNVKTSHWPSFEGRLWQPNYYEHVIRNESNLTQIRTYIANNPAQWSLDRENPINF